MLALMADRKFWDFGLVKMFQFVCVFFLFFFSIYFTYLKLRVLKLIFLSHNI